MPKPAAFPREVTLGDGSPGRVRPIVPADREAMLEGFHALRAESRIRRFFHEKRSVSEAELDDVSNPDGVDHLALLLEVPGKGGGDWELAAVARCYREPSDPELAEVAFVTRDETQGVGAGTEVIRALAEVAWRAGIRRWFAPMLANNLGSRRLLAHVGRLSEDGPIESGVREYICHLHAPAA
jgi:RimJ/RimL family protein N-acetyltransferase